MHMSDALVSPAVGCTMWAVSAGATAMCARRLGREATGDRVPLMGVTAAFVFAAQMLNFTIPATGSSGHLGGGLILSILLGPPAAFLAMASVLAVQALFFADGGLLAFGCNLFNLGAMTCFVAHPLVYRPLAGQGTARWRIALASIAAAVVGLQLGSFSVVMETGLSGISDLSFGSFLLLMQPIHLAIGLVEGVATAAVVSFVARVRPEILVAREGWAKGAGRRSRAVLAAMGIAAIVAAGGLGWFASTRPDGLEWSVSGVTGKEELDSPEGGIHGSLGSVQRMTAFLPGYGFEHGKDAGGGGEDRWPAVDVGTSVAGIAGSAITLLAIVVAGLAVARFRPRGKQAGDGREGGP